MRTPHNNQQHPLAHTRRHQPHNPMNPHHTQRHPSPEPTTHSLPNPTTPHPKYRPHQPPHGTHTQQHSPMTTTQPTRNPSPIPQPHQPTLAVDTDQPTPIQNGKPQHHPNTSHNRRLDDQTATTSQTTRSTGSHSPTRPPITPTLHIEKGIEWHTNNGSLNETEP